jgi:hypothetical protein
LKTLYPTNTPEFELITDISATTNDSLKVRDSVRGDIPSIDDMIKRHGDMFYYSLTVRISVSTLNGNEEDRIRENFIKTSDFVRGRGVKDANLRFTISVTDEDAGYLCKYDFSDSDSIEGTLNYCLSKPSKEGVF